MALVIQRDSVISSLETRRTQTVKKAHRAFAVPKVAPARFIQVALALFAHVLFPESRLRGLLELRLRSSQSRACLLQLRLERHYDEL